MDRGQDIPFVYEDGVLKPEGPVDLPEGARGVARVLSPSDGLSDFWRNPSLDELRAKQKPLPVRSLEDLAGLWPEDESVDEFIESLRRERR